MSERVLVLGHKGLVGSAICRALADRPDDHFLLTTPAGDLRHSDTWRPLLSVRPTLIYMAAAKVGGIAENAAKPACFIEDNLRIQTHAISLAHHVGAKLLFLGSSCIYPRECPQPIREEYLGTGSLEPTNEAYAWAKLAGIAMVKAYRKQYGFRGICLMPTNLYGPGDRFDDTGHLVPSLMRRMHEAMVRGEASVTVWGTGTPRRELLHVDDLARACVHLMNMYEGEEIVNVGTGEDLSVREIAALVADVVGFRGRVEWDASKPDGTPRKVLDVTRVNALGWRAEIPLRRGLEETYAWYLENGAC